jgi:hypothetical protein
MNHCCEMNDSDLDNVSRGAPMASSNCGQPGYNFCWVDGVGGPYAGDCPKPPPNLMDAITRFVNSAKRL